MIIALKNKTSFMKMIKQLLAITGGALIMASCQDTSDDKARIESEADSRQNTEQPATTDNATSETSKYVDLKTGQPTDLYYDNDKHITYSAVTQEPVDLYVNTATMDTVYGRGRYIVNDYVIKTPEGTYKLDDAKVKVTKDGIKIKDGNKKIKIEEGEMKIKDGNSKYKVDEDEEKYKDGTIKMKTEDDESKMKSDGEKVKTKG
jgi:hypothetical protein